MKRVNLTLLLALTVTVVVAVVGTFFLRRFQILRNAGGLAKLARQRLDEGKSAEALLLFQRYVGLRPEDSTAFAEYAELMLRKTESSEVTRADLAKAYTVLEDAVRRNPKNDKLRARLAQFQLRVGRFADAREHLEVHVVDGAHHAAAAAEHVALQREVLDQAPHRQQRLAHGGVHHLLSIAARSESLSRLKAIEVMKIITPGSAATQGCT